MKLVSVSSLSVVVCKLPLLEGVSGFTWVEVKSVTLRPRLQAHVVGNNLSYEVIRLHKDKTGHMINLLFEICFTEIKNF